jgi:hypothetical protein
MEASIMRAKSLTTGILAAFLCLLGTALVPAARAGVDVDLGASVPLGDQGRLFFDISSRYFDMEPTVVRQWGARYASPDDLAVCLFISRQSHRSPDVIFALRRQGLSWWDVGLRVGIPVDTWFLQVARDPGPPYGRAYASWRRHRENPKFMVVLRDAEVRNLVAVRMAHEYYGVPPEEAMRWRASGRNVRDVMVEQYEIRHRGDGRAHDRGEGRGHRAKRHGHDRGHDHDEGHGGGHD